MFEDLEKIHSRPAPFEFYTAASLWTDDYRAEQMLRFHLDDSIDVSSRNGAFLDRSAAWITQTFELGPGKALCDFGCGPGLYTSRLAQSGAQVTGVDFSRNSIEYARNQARSAGLPITYVNADYLEFTTEQRFGLITMIMCDFCALGPAQRQKLLAIWHALLAEGGAILLDVYSMAAFAERHEAHYCEKNQLNHFWHAQDYYAFVNTFKYDQDAVVLDKYCIVPARGETETVYNWLQYFSPDNLSDELAQAGFLIDQVFGDVAGGSFSPQQHEFAAVIRKRA